MKLSGKKRARRKANCDVRAETVELKMPIPGVSVASVNTCGDGGEENEEGH